MCAINFEVGLHMFGHAYGGYGLMKYSPDTPCLLLSGWPTACSTMILSI